MKKKLKRKKKKEERVEEEREEKNIKWKGKKKEGLMIGNKKGPQMVIWDPMGQTIQPLLYSLLTVCISFYVNIRNAYKFLWTQTP